VLYSKEKKENATARTVNTKKQVWMKYKQIQKMSPVGARFSAPQGPPSLLYNIYRVSFLRAKRPERGVNHIPPSSAEVKERVELYFYSPSGSSWPIDNLTLYTLGRRKENVRFV
jgi:hypothetical protein